MQELWDPYSRDQALADGVLIDVTDIAEDVGLPWPVAMSVSLWNSFALKGKPENLRTLVEWADLRDRHAIFEKDSAGYLVYGAYFGMSGYARVRIFVERDAKGVITGLVLLDDQEDFDLRCPRVQAGSFYTV